MAVSFSVSGLGFAKLNTTTMPITSIEYSPNLGVEPFRSGGDIAPSMVRRAGARPVFRFTAPLDSVYGVLGSLLPVTLTAMEMYSTIFSGPLRTATGATIYKLDTTNGHAYACISAISASGGPIPLALAEVTVFLCSNAGLLNPVTSSTGALPTLGATPNLHVLSTLVDNATGRWGVKNWRIDVGMNMEPIQMDGFFFPTDYRLGAISATASIAHADVVAIFGALTGLGKDGTGAGFILYARAYNMATKLLDVVGYSFTFLNAFAELDSIGLQGTDIANAVLRLTAYAAPGTLVHPVTVGTSATIPT